MSDAFQFVVSFIGQLVSWLFSSSVNLQIGSYAAPIGAVFCASTILSVIVGTLLSYFKGGQSLDISSRLQIKSNFMNRGK